MYTNQQLREEFNIFAQQLNPNFMLTLTTNKSWNAAAMKSLVGKFFRDLDRKLLGNAWLEKAIEERIDGVAFVEKPNLNVHAHCMVGLNFNRWYETLKRSREVWKKLCPSGRVHFEPISYARDAIDYGLKETESRYYKFDDQIILLWEFHPQR